MAGRWEYICWKNREKAEVDVPNAVEELKQPRKYLTVGNFEVIKDAFYICTVEKIRNGTFSFNLGSFLFLNDF